MNSRSRPFETHRRRLYTTDELLDGFDPLHPATLAQTLDYRIYRYWIVEGRYKPKRREGMLQALHDNAITYAAAQMIKARKVVGIMGGHAVARDSTTYAQVALLARDLTRNGFLVASGGGPGVMEAAHFGAFHVGAGDEAFAVARRRLADQAIFPSNAGQVVGRDGVVNEDALEAIVQWLTVAVQLRGAVARLGESLGIPTWRYGHEPTSVFATNIAKYFENSVREDGLLSIATRGIVYAEGGAGTLQEVFQSAVFNAYADADRNPSPMIFLGTAFWRRSGVLTALQQLFGAAAFDVYVACTDDIEVVADVLARFDPDAAPPPKGPRSEPAPSLPTLLFDLPQDDEEEL